MSKVKFIPNIAGFNELRKSKEMESVLREYADQVAKKAGAGYEVEDKAFSGTTRINIEVQAVTQEAVNDNYKNNTLLKAISR